MAVFILDKQKNPLMLCSETRARLLLECGRAVIVYRDLFTIRLRDRLGGEIQPLGLKLNPIGITHRYSMPLQRSNSYTYFPQPTIAMNKKEAVRQAT
jgi:hypothetical protein